MKQKAFEVLSEKLIETDNIEGFFKLWENHPDLADDYMSNVHELIKDTPSIPKEQVQANWERFRKKYI